MLLHRRDLLDTQAWKRLDHRHRRRDPLSDQHILLGRVHAHSEVEQGLGRRKPVRLLVRPGVLVLDVEVERTIRSRPIGPTLLSKSLVVE